MSSGRDGGLFGVDTSQPIVLTLIGRVTPADVPRLCAELADAGPGDVICEIGALTHADLTTVDTLARLRLAAGRLGHRITFRGAGAELRRLLDLVGLADLV